MVTDYPRGVSSFGGVIAPGFGHIHNGVGVPNGGSTLRPNRHYWVQGNLGSDGNSGTQPDRPLRTMQAAFNLLGSGDVIHFQGNIAEQISTPAGVFDVTVIGEGNQPRHADAHTTSNGYSSATWKTAGTASTPLVTVRQQGWKFLNTLFDPPADAAAIQLFRDGGAGDAEDDASHAHIAGCKFVAGQNHIEFKGGLSQVVIENNLFFGATGDSIADTVGAGIGTDNYFRIINNEFHGNDTHIDVPLNYASIRGNTFGAFTTMSVDLTGGSNNIVWGNYMSGDYDAKYVAGTSDEWAGNYSMDVSSAEVGAEGLTIAVPVA